MKILKKLALSFLFFVYSVSAHSETLNSNDYNEYFQVVFCYKAHRKALTLINMINEQTEKNNHLKLMLSVELNCLEDEINDIIIELSNQLNEDKVRLQSIDISKLKDPSDFDERTEAIEREEQFIQKMKEGLRLVKQWKKDYCR
jgi:hypothetical protein